MDKYESDTFGVLNAANYDQEHDPGTTAASVALLAELCEGAGTVLELAIGTGRVALPLAARGIRIHGIDASPAMLEVLHNKPGSDQLTTSIADMADFDLPQKFDFAYLIFNTLFNLKTQAAQVSCLQHVARHLNPGGRFLIETIVPDLSGFHDGQYVKTDELSFDDLRIEAATHDPISQRIECQRVHFTQAGVTLKPFVYRYAWPAEIDLMAQLAGLRLEQRWGDWQRGAFTGTSPMHVSLYRK